jgi:5-(carboxyamino)imidazole ribonucleotide mutase
MTKALILMGSDSDLPVMKKAADVFKDFGVPFRLAVASAHRTPDRVRLLMEEAMEDGCRVFIAGAGGAAHLAGFVAAHTVLPVIGVPILSALKGLDSLLSTVQMPSGIPVATVAVDGATNAGLLAVQILATSDDRLKEKLLAHRGKMAEEVKKKSEKAEAELKQKL